MGNYKSRKESDITYLLSLKYPEESTNKLVKLIREISTIPECNIKIQKNVFLCIKKQENI